jgi:hypothetical protein
MDNQTIDSIVFLIANFINIVMVFLFICRKKGKENAEYILGLLVVVMVLPLISIIIFNIFAGRESWFYTLIIPMIFFLVVEYVLDYQMKRDFRNTSLVWPYIFLYYLALLGMIGYCFLINKVFGFITMFTYFLNLFATWYAHSK